MNAKVSWEQLNSIADDLITYAKDNISGQIRLIKELQGQAEWEGADREKVMAQFSSFMDDMQKLATAIENYGQHLKVTAEGYKQTSTAVGNSW